MTGQPDPAARIRRLDDHTIDRSLALTVRAAKQTFLPRLGLILLAVGAIAGVVSFWLGLPALRALVVAAIVVVSGLALGPVFTRRLALTLVSITEICGAAMALLSFGRLDGRVSEPVDPTVRPLAEAFNVLLEEREGRELARAEMTAQTDDELAALRGEVGRSTAGTASGLGGAADQRDSRRATLVAIGDDASRLESLLAAPSTLTLEATRKAAEIARSVRRRVEDELAAYPPPAGQ